MRELAAANPGLCVITSRHRVADLEHHSRTTAPTLELEHLSDEAGAEVLLALGVQGPEEELRQTSREFAGHGLALNLLGAYLRDVFDGDVRCRSEVSLLREDAEQGGHARRVMDSYEKWLGEGPELAVLRLMGLFDRPADGELGDVLRAPPAIPGLTDSLFRYQRQGGLSGLFGRKEPIPMNANEWRHILARLRRARLLAESDPHQPDNLDAHPLVREHFGQQLREQYPGAWREGHSRLYEHLKGTAKQYPETIEEMALLYAAVAHGCQAGLYQEALDEVYWERIQRGNEFYSKRKLGAFGADLAVLSRFFDPPWSKPVADLKEGPFVLNEAGISLRALGRLREAAQPMLAGLETYSAQEDWKNATIAASNLSELYLTIEDLSNALKYAQHSFELADRSGDWRTRMVNRTTLANALHQAGRPSEAEAAFREAEEMQKERQPEYQLLYSLQGFHYCDLLLSQGKYREVLARAGQALEWATQQQYLLDIALGHLSLGRAHLFEAQEGQTGDFSRAATYLDRAVEGLRQAGQQQELPRGLIARAELHRVCGAFERAQRDLHGAMSIAERGGMGLFQADCHLGYARLCLAMEKREKAQEHLTTAKEMVERMGYHRRDGEVEELEEQLGEK